MTKNVKLVWGFLLAFLIAQPRPVDAQAQIRVNAGATFATIEGDDAERPFGGDAADLRTETGFFAGASLSVPLGGILSISPGLYVVQKGMSFEDVFGRNDSIKLSYIEVPVTIGVEVTGPERPFGVRLFAGPEIAFEIDCDLEFGPGLAAGTTYGQFDDCIARPEVEGSEREESERKAVDLGLVFGADASYGPFFVRGGLDLGLTSLDDSGAGEDFRNSAWFLGAGIVIGG